MWDPRWAPPLGFYYRGEQFLINHYWCSNLPILLPMTRQQLSFTIEVGTKNKKQRRSRGETNCEIEREDDWLLCTVEETEAFEWKHKKGKNLKNHLLFAQAMMIPTTGHSTLVVHSLHLGGYVIHLPICPANLAIYGSRSVVLYKKRLAKLASFGAF